MVEPPFFEAAVAAGDFAAGRRAHPASTRSSSATKAPRRSPASMAARCAFSAAAPRTRALMVIYGYARLVGYDAGLATSCPTSPRASTWRRTGASPSICAPATAGRTARRSPPRISAIYWEDIANNAEVSRFGPPKELLVDGEKPVVEFPDELTVRYTWSKPNSLFPAGARRAPSRSRSFAPRIT